MAAKLPEEPPLGAAVLDSLTPGELRRMWDDCPASILVTAGPSHVLVYQNPAAADVLGRLPRGKPLRDLLPEITSLGQERLDSVLSTGRTIRTQAHALPMPSVGGELLVMRYVMAPLGQPPRAVIIMGIDVSDQARTL